MAITATINFKVSSANKNPFLFFILFYKTQNCFCRLFTSKIFEKIQDIIFENKINASDNYNEM